MSRLAVLGTGLIGGSIGLAARADGAFVTVFDQDGARAERALEIGAADAVAASIADAVQGADLVFVAVPVSFIGEVVVAALDAGAPLVTDVGSVKASIVAAVGAARPHLAARYVGGHPMAGSEQDGLDGARADLFRGATWALTPSAGSESDAYATVRNQIVAFGAEVIAYEPGAHDALVAVVSHVPQLAATTLMNVAAERSADGPGLFRLAAGGFRDMTRIAASHPAIWADICAENRDAIIDALDDYIESLREVRTVVDTGDREGLLALLSEARAARRSLPVGATTAGPLAEMRVPIPDRPGMLAEVTTLAGALGINISDIETAHSAEGREGVLILVVTLADAPRFEDALRERGFQPAWLELA
jgi:prephenate dehydrogenase